MGNRPWEFRQKLETPRPVNPTGWQESIDFGGVVRAPLIQIDIHDPLSTGQIGMAATGRPRAKTAAGVVVGLAFEGEVTGPIGPAGAAGAAGTAGAAGPVGPAGPAGPSGTTWVHSYVDMVASGSVVLVNDDRDITWGAMFGVFGSIGDSIAVTGVRFYAKYTSYPRTIRISMWDNGGVLRSTDDVVVSAEGVVDAVFTTPYTLPATQYQRYLTVGMWDTSGAPKSTGKYSGWPGFIFTGPFIAGPNRIDYSNSWYESGDANPMNNSPGTFYPIEPVVTVL